MENNFKEYKNVYDNTKISVEADEKLRIALDNLPTTKKNKKVNIAVAAAIFICVVSMFSTTEFQVKAYSVIKTVFAYFSRDSKLNDNYDKYSKPINKAVANNGVEVTIDSVVSDSLGVTLGYTVKTEESIKGAGLGINKLLINGKEVEFENMTSYDKEINNGEYVGYDLLKVKDLPENFKLEVVVTNVGLISGQWDFKLDISNTEINKNTFFTNSSFQKVSENGTLNISKIVSTPLNTYIELTYKSKNPITSDDKVPFSTVFLLDENNRMVNVEGVNSTVIDEYTYRTEFYIKEYKGMLNKLTIIPYKAPKISYEPRKLQDDNEFYNLKTKTPFVIKAGDLGSIKINSIVQTQDKVAVNCSTDSIYGDWIISSIGLCYDINLNDDKPALYNFAPMYYNESTMNNLKSLTNLENFALEFDKEPGSNKDKYMLVFQKYIEGIKIYPELKITVPVN